MDPVTVRLKVYNKSLEGVLRILEEMSWRVADGDSRESILKTIRKNLENLSIDIDKYEKRLTS